MLYTINSFKAADTRAVPVTVEVDVADSGIGIHLVGLADTAVKESLLRVVTALQANGYHCPGRRVIINIAPADLYKSGSGYDLPIALAILAASRQETFDDKVVSSFLFRGELGLDGSVRDVPGGFIGLEHAEKTGKMVVLPMETAMRECRCPASKVAVVTHLREAIALCQGDAVEKYLFERQPNFVVCPRDEEQNYVDFADIPGNEGAKRALEIAAAGGHHIFLMGAPGSGKATLAKALNGILPAMTEEEYRDMARVWSVTGRRFPRTRPFRAPHVSASLSAFIGGGIGDAVLPGEVSLAHNGTLFLDEFAEMPRGLTEALRGPIEDRKVVISRLRAKTEYPAHFMLVAASNPCPCGYYGEGDRCTCKSAQREAYRSRLSGPVMDRIDVQAWLHPTSSSVLERTDIVRESSDTVRGRVEAARRIQEKRFAGTDIRLNGEMNAEQALRYCGLSEDDEEFVEEILVKMNMSARAFVRMLRIARTIADLAGSEKVQRPHLAEAASYRFLDRRAF